MDRRVQTDNERDHGTVKCFIITLKDIKESIKGADKVRLKLLEYGHDVTLFDGIPGPVAEKKFQEEGREKDIDALKLHQFHIDSLDNPGKKGGFCSHYHLWKYCMENNQEIIVFEDDVILYRDYMPVDYEDVLLLGVNFELSRSNEDHKFKETALKPLLISSVGEPISIQYYGDSIPGACIYAIKPSGAKKLLERYAYTYNATDHAIKSEVCDIKVHNHLMGKADNSKSFTMNYYE